MIRVYMMMGLAIAITSGVAYHFFTINSLESQVADLEKSVIAQASVITRQKETNEKNKQEINEMKTHQAEQAEELSSYMVKNNELVEQRDRYLRIFADHNLTRLARAKPGLIERRINGGTKSVFRSIEDDSKMYNILFSGERQTGLKDD